jgi:hypothetical protein
LVLRPLGRFPRQFIQWVAIAALLRGAMLALTPVPELSGLRAEQWRLVVGTPGAWLPLGVAMAVLAYALYLEARARMLGSVGWSLVALAGVAAVAWFFRGGQIDWQHSRDWQKEWTYYAAIKEGLSTGHLPWHLTSTFHYTNKFFANPETVVAPHVIALAWLNIPTFVFLQSVMIFTAGIAALRAFTRDLAFGPIATVTFLAVFTLNGYVLGHLGGGHLQWITCFLYPGVLLFVHRLAAGDTSPRTQAGLACALAAFLVVGGWHMFVWGGLFTAAFCAVDRARWRPGAVAALLTAGLGAYRLLPAVIAHGDTTIAFLGSYRSVATLAAAFVGDPQPFDGMMWIEYDAYVGWVGLALICAGLTAPLGKRWHTPIASLWLPSLVMLVLACGYIYRETLFQLPGFNSQRVVTRFMIVPLLGFTAIGCAQLNAWLRERRWWPVRLGALAVVAVMLVFLAAQLFVRADQRRPAPATGIAVPSVSVIQPTPPSAGDVAGLAAGSAISLASLGLAIRMWRRRPQTPVVS